MSYSGAVTFTSRSIYEGGNCITQADKELNYQRDNARYQREQNEKYRKTAEKIEREKEIEERKLKEMQSEARWNNVILWGTVIGFALWTLKK